MTTPRRPAELDRTTIDPEAASATAPGPARTPVTPSTRPPVAPTPPRGVAGLPTPPHGIPGVPRAINRTVPGSGPVRATGPQPAVEPIKLGPGIRIEQYELIRELGRGGMGQVFLARDSRLGRRVAMKFLASNSPRFTQRFLVEARATAQFSHENIVVIHAVDEHVGLPYMVLEYLEGATLGSLIGDKRVPVGRTVELIVPVVKALVSAHAANIVHRDLKPDNVIVTTAGTVKVLDFGIAKLFAAPVETAPRSKSPTGPDALHQTRAGAIVGTLPYMSPEQLGTEDVDHRSDLWAVGIILYELLAAKHPLDPVTQGKLFGAAAAVDVPMPSIGDEVPGLPDRLVQIVDRCLAKRKGDRYATAAELLTDLEPLLPGRSGRSLGAEDNPYPGLNSFQEADANRFFGRTQDVAGMIAKLHDQPLVAVVGPSGVGKSSFVRAGVVPALKNAGEPWEFMIVRPGRHPLAALASTLLAMRDSRDSDPVMEGEDLPARLRAEPGTLGARLRARARRRRTQIVLFVDQHEELYTLVPDPAERLAFTACLAGAADDPSGPIRVIVAMRSDFLDRAAEDRRFVDELTRGLVFLQPPSLAGLEAALTQPLDMLGFGFEPGIVADMLETLEATPGSLPLLQFTAAKLWETRDRGRRVLTEATYAAMGGVAGALATHADEVVAGLAAPDQKVVRAIFQRLVTPERTRAVVEASELRDVSPEVDRLIGHLVSARLLVVQTRGEGEAAVELVHESLIKSWPTLKRWLDENQDDSVFLGQVRAAAKQWDAKGRPQGLLWRGDAMEEARLWSARFTGDLAPRERAFLDDVIALGTRATRIKRRLIVAAFAFLLVLIAGAGLALLSIREAEHAAVAEAKRAADEAEKANAATEKEAAARQQLQDKVQELVAAEEARVKAVGGQLAAKAAETKAVGAASKSAELALAAERRRLEAERLRADAERKRAADARALAEKKRLEAERRGKITNELR